MAFSRRRKKASAADVTFMMIFVTGLALVTVLAVYLNAEVSDAFIDSGLMTPAAEQAINDTRAAFDGGIMDNVFLIVFAGMVLSIVILAFMINVHPAFAIVYIIVSIINTLVAVPLANMYYEYRTNAILAGASSGFTIQNHIMGNLPIYILVVSIIVGVATYAKLRSDVLRLGGATGGI